MRVATDALILVIVNYTKYSNYLYYKKKLMKGREGNVTCKDKRKKFYKIKLKKLLSIVVFD